MRTRHAVILYMIGLMLQALGALFKILHYAGADQMLIASTALQIAGGLLFLIKLVTYPKFKDFLDW